MKGLIDRFGLEVLDEDECFELMATMEVGRLAVVSGGVPLIFPVNYAVVDGNVVIRTAPGTKLTAAGRNQVTIEADEIDPATHTGWSVVVRGRAEEITDFDPSDDQGAAQHRPQTRGPARSRCGCGSFPLVVTGRRLRSDHPPAEPGSQAGRTSRRGRCRSTTNGPAGWPAGSSASTRRKPSSSGAHDRRHAAFAMVDSEGRRLALASYDGAADAPTRSTSAWCWRPESGEDGVEAGALLVRRLAAVAHADGARRIVADYDLLIADVAESLALTGFTWVVQHQDRSARAELALPVDD